MQGLIAGVVAVALVISAGTLRPGETEFIVSIIRTPMVAAAVPAVWVLLQVLPLGMLAHPIWTSAGKALGHPLAGTISVDPGASIIALGQYLSMSAVAFLSAAVAVDRQRAKWILFALTAAAAAIALILLIQDLVLTGVGLSPFSRMTAIDCASTGVIIASAACIRTIEHYETRHSRPQQSMSILLWIFAGSTAALTICATALVLSAPHWIIFASGCGLAALITVWIIHRFGLGPWGTTAIAVPVLAVAVLVMTTHPPERGASVPLAFAAGSSASLMGLSQRVLEDSPLVGIGAGAFAAIAPIYREIDEPPAGSAAATTAATFAIELGRPMLWLITVATAASILFLLLAALRRGRDSFYPAMGGGCLITILLLAFANAGMLETATELIVAAALGLAFAQSKSRTVRL